MKPSSWCVLTCLLGFSFAPVNGQTVVLKIDDGVIPLSDGETQAEKLVKIDCDFNGIALGQKQALQYSSDGVNNWEKVVLAGELQGSWKSKDYKAVETFTGNNALMSFTIISIKMADEGTYKCQLYTKSGEVERQIAADEQLLRIYAKTVSVEFKDLAPDGKMEAIAGVSKTITCVANNGSKPTMQLKVDGTVVQENMSVEEDASTPGVYIATSQQTFTTDQNNAQLTCSAKVTTFDQRTEVHTNLQITAKPTISCSPKSRAAAVGSTIEFTCLVSGVPLPTADKVEWTALSDGQTVKGNEDQPDQGLMSMAKVNADGILEVVLSVTVMATRKTERFTITAVNSRGTAAEPASMTLEEPGPTGSVNDDGNGSATALSIGIYAQLLVLLVGRLLL